MGEIERADEAFVRATRPRGAMAGYISTVWRSSRAFAEGRYAEGDELVAEAYRLGTDLGDANEGIWGRAVQESSIERGDIAAALANYELTRDSVIMGLGPELALLRAAEGADDEARELIARWVTDLMPVLPGLFTYSATYRVALLAERMGMPELAPPVWEFLQPFSGELLASAAWVTSAVDHALGLLALTMDRIDDAVDRLHAGHELHARCGFHALSSQSAYDLGRTLLRRGAPGDREAGERLLAAAADLAEQIGRVPLARDARALLS
jgi:hypothetical protein